MKSCEVFALLQRKKKEIQAKCESSSPVKITNCRIQKNPYTQQNEVQINKRTKISDPLLQEVTFNVMEVEKDKSVKKQLLWIFFPMLHLLSWMFKFV